MTRWTPAWLLPATALGAALAPIAAHSKIYVSVEQAQRDSFGAAALTPFPVALTSAQQDQLHDASSVSLPFQGNRIWKAADGGWFVVDEVVGKHETITYAVAINADGTVKKVEILEYRESYGYEVAEDKWLQQFVGQGADAPLKLGKDVENISGATLSSKHVADGVKRVLAMYGLVLKGH
jgi:hypothetical protein